MMKKNASIYQRAGGYFTLDRAVYESAAFKSLSCRDRAALLQILFHYIPNKSELIAMSSRRLALCIGINKDTAAKSLRHLVKVGLLDIVSEADWISGQARKYRLTFKPFKNRTPTDEWSKYQNDEPNSSDKVSK